jgi:hypothetical protein
MYSLLMYSALLYSALLYSALLYSALLYSALLYSLENSPPGLQPAGTAGRHSGGEALEVVDEDRRRRRRTRLPQRRMTEALRRSLAH